MRVTILRHAEDRAAAAGRYGDEGLTARGRAQAAAAAAALRGDPPAFVRSSPLRRARETAEILAGAFGVPIELDPDLAEGALGALEGLDRDEARRRFPDDLREGPTVLARLRAAGRTAPGGEPLEAFLARAARVARAIRALLDAEGSHAVLVTHGGIACAALCELLGLGAARALEAPFGFDHAGAARLWAYRETPSRPWRPMVRFAPPVAAGAAAAPVPTRRAPGGPSDRGAAVPDAGGGRGRSRARRGRHRPNASEQG